MAVETKVFDINKNNDMKAQFKLRGTMYHLLYLFMVNTALRVHDVISIQKKNIHGNRLILKEQKTGKTQDIALNSGIMEVLPEYLKTLKSDDDYLFPSRQKNGKEPHITRQRVSQIIKECAKAIGLDTAGISCHSLRKMRARALYEANNNDIGLVMKQLNHSSQAVSLRYMGYTREALDKANKDTVL